MTIHANGTDAKEIVIRFFELKNIRATPPIYAKTMSQCKSILSAGYTKEEIIEVMEYIILEKKVDMYSIGYISASINDMLREINEKKAKEEAEKRIKEIREQLASSEQTPQSEVRTNDESTQRNREKAERGRTGVQSRLRKKFNFDMFEGQ